MYSPDHQLTEAEEYKKFCKVPPPSIDRQALNESSYSSSTMSHPYSSTDYTTNSTVNTKTTSLPASEDKPKPKVPWSTGLFDCLSDVNTCCITCWCPCITFGKIAHIVDKGSASCGVSAALYTLIAFMTGGCACCYSHFYRGKMRQQHSLHQTPCADCLVHCFCEFCALCQEYRQLQFQGYDMQIGWHGNIERQRRKAEMAEFAPAVEDGMRRSTTRENASYDAFLFSVEDGMHRSTTRENASYEAFLFSVS